MSLPLSLTIFLILFSTCSIEAATIDISIQQYTGLKRSEIHGIENQYYYFEFCACPNHFKEFSLPKNLDKCVCSEQKRGTQLKNSIPTVKFYSLFNKLRLKLDNEKISQSSQLFVKVSIGTNILTNPEYQALLSNCNKNEVLLKTGKQRKMRLIYTSMIDSIPFDEPTNDEATKAEQHWKNSVLNDAKGGATDFFRDVTNQKNIEIKKNEFTESNNDIRILNTMNSVQKFLFAKSRIDKMEPTNYDIPQLKNWLLTYHNSYRAMHNSPPVTENSFLDMKGKLWADELAYHKGCLVHQQPRVYGENLFFFGARHFPNPKTLANAIIQSFYLEGIGYNYSSWRPLSYFKTGHFTQLIWKESKQIGVGVSIVKNTSVRSPCLSSSGNVYYIFVVIKYDPAGNFETKNAYLENVQRP